MLISHKPPLSVTKVQFSSVQSISRVRFFATTWTAACQASLSLTISRSLPKCMSTASVMTSSHLILWHPLLQLSIFPSIRNFSNESKIYISTIISQVVCDKSRHRTFLFLKRNPQWFCPGNPYLKPENCDSRKMYLFGAIIKSLKNFFKKCN